MIPIFHVFKKTACFEKQSYTTEARQEFSFWEEKLISQVGFIENELLILPEEKKHAFGPARKSGIIITDVINYSVGDFYKDLSHLQKQQRPSDWWEKEFIKNDPHLSIWNAQLRKLDFGMFFINRNEDGEFELHFNGDQEFLPHRPRRDSQKLWNLTKGKSLFFAINYKSDSTMSWRKKRTYHEYEYIFEYLGDVKDVEFRPLNKMIIERKIPETFDKEINLRKILY